MLEAMPLSVDIHLVDLNLKISNIYISEQLKRLSKSLKAAIEERVSNGFFICGDLNYLAQNFQKTFDVTRIDHVSTSAIDVIEHKDI